MRKLFLALLVGGLLGGVAYAGEISVTEVEIKGNQATVVINEVIEIREIKIVGDDVEFPTHISRSGREFPQVKFLTEEARNVVVDAILKNRPSKEPIKKIDYKVTKMSPFRREGSSLKAFAAVTFNGVMEVECKVMESRHNKDEFWVSWPSRRPRKDKGEKEWQKQILIVNRKVKSIVEKDVIETFKRTGPGGVIMTDADIEIKEGLIDAPLTVTAVEVREVKGEGDLVAIAQVDLNYSFRIMDIKVYERSGQTFLEFPVFVSRRGKKHDQIKIFSKKLRSEIKRAIKSGTPSEKTSKKIGFEITKFEKFWREESAMKYFCAVTINGAIEIECKIIDGPDYDAFVSWPSSKEGDRFVDKIMPCNLKVKNVIEDALLKRYHKEYRKERKR